MRRHGSAVAVTVVALVALTACSGGGSEEPGEGGPSTDAAPSATPPPTASTPPRPARDGCYRLGFDEAVSPTSAKGVRECSRPHTAETFEVGRVDNVVDGHLVAIDSAQVQDGVAETCTSSFGSAAGGTADQQRLSMLRPVWFTPTLAQSDQGQDWYRCDLVALGGGERLLSLEGPSLRGALATAEGNETYGMCGTAAPDAADFARVPCGQAHSWRAVEVVELPDGDYPGADAAREAGQQQCEDAGRDRAADPLDFDWSYEFPDAEQWGTGQTFGRCWVPD